MEKLTEFEQLEGQTCTAVERDGESIVFTLLNGDKYRLHHNQDCCEDVHIEDICDELRDLASLLHRAREWRASSDHPSAQHYVRNLEQRRTDLLFELASWRRALPG